ncbi:MAG: DUF1566 domain-containing protein, partial [Candidatus Lokiarchaeota archaeon]|nr:DUF1566 domain-containing protein [Candidatus Lokiarchaeota archaeon]
ELKEVNEKFSILENDYQKVIQELNQKRKEIQILKSNLASSQNNVEKFTITEPDKTDYSLNQNKFESYSEIKENPILRLTKFRNIPKSLSKNDLIQILEKHDFHDRCLNTRGRGYSHQFLIQVKRKNRVIQDKKWNLMWQQGGSTESLMYAKAIEYIDKLNQEMHAGYADWRLPTIEEAASLIQKKKKNGLYIDPVFDNTQRWIWTNDLVAGSEGTWVVSFYKGCCLDNYIYSYSLSSVRAVRSIK